MVDVVVPIRFDLEVDGNFLKDAFCWSSRESDENLEEFAVGLCKDVKVPFTFVPLVVDAMRQQINEFRLVEEKAKARSLQEPERLEVIHIKLRSGTTSIEDQFVWDIFNRGENDPERFAQVLCKELALDPKKMKHLIAHKIREEVFKKKKELFLPVQAVRTAGSHGQGLGVHSGKRGGGGVRGGYGGAGASPSKLAAQSRREYQKLLPNKVGVKRSAEEQSDYRTVVTHLTEEEATELDNEDEKNAIQERQESVAKKIGEIQQEHMNKRKQKYHQERWSMKMSGLGPMIGGNSSSLGQAAKTVAFGLPHAGHPVSSFPAMGVNPHSTQVSGAAHPSFGIPSLGMGIAPHGASPVPVVSPAPYATSMGQMPTQQQGAYSQHLGPPHLQPPPPYASHLAGPPDPMGVSPHLDPIHAAASAAVHASAHPMNLNLNVNVSHHNMVTSHQMQQQLIGGSQHHHAAQHLGVVVPPHTSHSSATAMFHASADPGVQPHSAHKGTAHYLSQLNPHQQMNQMHQLHPQAASGVYASAQPMSHPMYHSTPVATTPVYAGHPAVAVTPGHHMAPVVSSIGSPHTYQAAAAGSPTMPYGHSHSLPTSSSASLAMPLGTESMYHHQQMRPPQPHQMANQPGQGPQQQNLGGFAFPPYMPQ